MHFGVELKLIVVFGKQTNLQYLILPSVGSAVGNMPPF